MLTNTQNLSIINLILCGGVFMFCKHCGKQINEDANFCSYCGGELRASAGNSISTNTNALPIVQPKDERKGMSIYFNDICRLEFIANSLREKSEILAR